MLRHINLKNFNSLIFKLYCTIPTEYKNPKFEIQENTKTYLNNFSKDIMLNIFNLDLFVFPELSNNYDLDRVNKLTEKLKVLSKIINKDNFGELMNTINYQLSNSGIFGLCVPELYHGSSYNYMMLCRVMESISNNVNYSLKVLIPQVISSQAILGAGTEQHKKLYLGEMANGIMKMSVALQEIPCDDIRLNKINTTAYLNKEDQVYILNGQKTMIQNLNDANFIIVFAKVSERLVGTFIVDAQSPGITSSQCHFNESLGHELKFENVRVPVSNFLTETSGLELARKLTSINNVSIAALCSGLMKSLMKKTNDFVSSRTIFGKPLSQSEIMQFKMISLADQVYTAETTVFYTAGLIDQYPDNDFFIESSLTKIICIEALSRSVDLCLKIMGANKLTKDDIEFANIYENAQKLLSDQVPLLKVKHSTLSETMSYMMAHFNSHKPLNFKIFERLGLLKTKIVFENNVIVNSFRFNLHPRVGSFADKMHDDLHEMGRFLEKIALSKDQDILITDLFLIKLSNILCNLFTIVTVLSRSSRSISIGLHNQDQEVNLAEFHTTQIMKDIKKQVQELKEYPKTLSLINETAKIIKENETVINIHSFLK